MHSQCHRRPAQRWHRQRGMALLETLVFFGAVMLIYVSASYFTDRWRSMHEAEQQTHAALFDAAWERSVARPTVELAGQRRMSLRTEQVPRRSILGHIVEAARDFYNNGFFVEPITGHRRMYDVTATGNVEQSEQPRPDWLVDDDYAVNAAMAASTPACFWPNTFFFDFVVGHFTLFVEAAHNKRGVPGLGDLLMHW